MAVDAFSSLNDSPTSPARRAYAVTPHATNELDPLPKALVIGGAGTITFRAVDSTVDVVQPVVAGQVLPVRVQYVRAAGTTATSILALA